IKTLADAGVPLARIKELLAADPDEFAAAMAEIDRKLQDRIAELQRTRERLAQLQRSRGGGRPVLSAGGADCPEPLRECGVSQRTAQMERDIWILLQAVAPQEAARWIRDKRAALGDPEFRAIYCEYDAAFAWPANDPRLDALAERTRRWMTNQPGRLE